MTLICHSEGAQVGRYFVKYGGHSLAEAETGQTGPPPGIDVEAVVFIATPNGGALDMLRLMNRGRTYLPWLGRRWTPETFFSFDSFYQHLPVYRDDLFFDANGEPVEADVFDPADWERFGWSIYDPAAQKRLARLGANGIFGDAAQRAAHLSERLDNTRRFHRLLQNDVEGFGSIRYYSLQSVSARTSARAVLVKEDGRWRTFFARDAIVRRNARFSALASTAGDGYATRESQLWLSPQERAALDRPPIYIEGRHLKLLLHPATQRWLLEILARKP